MAYVAKVKDSEIQKRGLYLSINGDVTNDLNYARVFYYHFDLCYGLIGNYSEELDNQYEKLPVEIKLLNQEQN